MFVGKPLARRGSKIILKQILWRQVVRTRGGSNCNRIVSIGGILY